MNARSRRAADSSTTLVAFPSLLWSMRDPIACGAASSPESDVLLTRNAGLMAKIETQVSVQNAPLSLLLSCYTPSRI